MSASSSRSSPRLLSSLHLSTPLNPFLRLDLPTTLSILSTLISLIIHTHVPISHLSFLPQHVRYPPSCATKPILSLHSPTHMNGNHAHVSFEPHHTLYPPPDFLLKASIKIPCHTRLNTTLIPLYILIPTTIEPLFLSLTHSPSHPSIPIIITIEPISHSNPSYPTKTWTQMMKKTMNSSKNRLTFNAWIMLGC